MNINKYEAVIGLEVHVELKTKSKMFCSCSADYFGKKPNTYTCPVCLGLPGALPVPNRLAIEWCQKIGAALNCELQELSKFDRKNYFYPDLPKGYQISQYDQPFCLNGSIEVNGKKIRIMRVHMEEDTGKLIHLGDSTLIDFNRSGVPLVEIVTKPDFNNSADVKIYLQEIQRIVRRLGVSNADMEKGDMRLEPNISASPSPSPSFSEEDELNINNILIPDYKVEIKNINSFKFVEKAIELELKRQTEVLDKGDTPKQETRGWDEDKQNTFSQRIKEEASDYRYFPEPDIPPFRFTNDYINKIREGNPVTTPEQKNYLIDTYSLPISTATTLAENLDFSNRFESSVVYAKEENITPVNLANAIINKKVDASLTGRALASTASIGYQVNHVDQSELEKVIGEVLKANQKAVSDFKSGQENAIMFLVGAVMRSLKVKADAQKIKASLLAKIK